MQLYKNRTHYLFVEKERSLWCSRFDGSLEAKPGSSISDLKAFDSISHLEGIVGKIQVFPAWGTGSLNVSAFGSAGVFATPGFCLSSMAGHIGRYFCLDSEPKLIIILAKSKVADIAGTHHVYRINRVGLLPLSPNEPLEGDRLLFSGHIPVEYPDNMSTKTDSVTESNLILMNRGVQKTLKSLRQAGTNFNIGLRGNRKDRSDRDKLERRILEDIVKMFNDAQSFYYSTTWNLTCSMQRLYKNKKHGSPACQHGPLWRQADERFFWNRDLWKDLLTGSHGGEEDNWIIPVMQGYVQMEDLVIDLNSFDSAGQVHGPLGEYVTPVTCRVTVISRRSRYRAGTRYKRRGTDEKGNCANYVESEQVVEIMGHCLSFVQLRGSIPVYWSQPGMRYRPAPRIDKSEKENELAFSSHFKEQLKMYKHQVLVSLVEQTGREKVLADAYLNRILTFDNENLVFVSFDFHEHCRGLRLENIDVLVNALQEVFQSMRFFWCKSTNVCEATEEQIMCLQRSVFRVNCVDCLDRTNVIQATFARFVLESQLRKMGLLMPETVFPLDCRHILQAMWANNGDVISRQYAGTSALKGDVTRTGERKLTGLMKDGYTSANRYYLNQFKDAYRQAAIDASLGKFFQEESILVPGVPAAVDPSEFERVKQLVDDCKRILIPETEMPLGGWPLIDVDRGNDPNRQDMDTVLLLSTNTYYVAEYSDESDQLVGFQKISLKDMDSIEIGQEMSMFRATRIVLRINYHIGDATGYCHQLRTAGLRFFNNTTMPVNTPEESIDLNHVHGEAPWAVKPYPIVTIQRRITEMLRSVGEAFRMALESVHDIAIPVTFGPMPKKTSKMPPKDVAAKESEGGIFTAVRASPSSMTPARPHIAVLSAVKNRLAGLNPIQRLPFANREASHIAGTTVAYSKEAEKSGLVPSISVQSPTSSPATSEAGTSDANESDNTTSGESSPLPDRKTVQAVLDSVGAANDPFPEADLLGLSSSSDSGPPVGTTSGNDRTDSERRMSVKQRHQSRSTEALDTHLVDLRSPLVLSASPSMKAFHDDNDSLLVAEHSSPLVDLVAHQPPSFQINGFESDTETNLTPGSPGVVPAPSSAASMIIKAHAAPNSSAKRACKTRIIEL